MRDERLAVDTVRRGAPRSGISSVPPGGLKQRWIRRAAAMIALLLVATAAIGSRAQAQLAVTSDTTINSGTTVSSVTVNNSATLTVSTAGNLLSNGTINVGNSGTGTLLVTSGSVTTPYLELGGNSSTRKGFVTISNDGVLSATSFGVIRSSTLALNGGSVITSSGSVGGAGGNAYAIVSSGTWNNSGNLLVGSAATIRGVLNINGGLMIVGGTLTKTADGTVSIAAGGTLQIGTGTNSGALAMDRQSASTTILTNNGTLIFNRSDASAPSAQLVGSGAVIKQGAGTLTLSDSSSYSGGTTLTAGSLVVGNTSALGTGNLAVNGGTLDLNGKSIAVATLSGSSGGIITSSTAGSITLTGSSASNSTFAGSIENGSGTVAFVKPGAGTLTLSGSNTYSGGTTVSAGSLVGTTSSLQGAITNNAAVTFDQATSGTYSGGMSGSGALTKLGAGAVTLTGANTYTGGTTVSAGTLLVNGSLANSDVTVGSGGTLGGSGTLGGRLTLLSGGTLSPGNSPGALAAAALDLQAGSTTFMQVIGSGSAAGVAGTAYDQMRITTASSLTYGGYLVLSFIDSPLFANGTMFSLFYFTGTAGGGFTSVRTAAGSSSYSGMTFQHNANGNWYTPDTSNAQYLVFNPASGQLAIVPEPSTWAMALMAGSSAAWMAWRRKRAMRQRRGAESTSPVA